MHLRQRHAGNPDTLFNAFDAYFSFFMIVFIIFLKLDDFYVMVYHNINNLIIFP